MELIIPYYKEYINLVSTFMEEIGRSHGADKAEQTQLRLIGEESFIFILGGIPKVGLESAFHLHCIEEPEGLAFYFSNHGRPMNTRQVPEFDVDKADETADALSLTMIRCFSQEFGYRNRGKEGWELLIRFQIKQYKSLNQLNAHEKDFEEAPLETISVRRATVEDVPGIIDLVYNTYRYSYAKELIYNDVELTQMIEQERILSLIAVTESGRIIGHNAVILDSPQLGEAGIAMVDPGYRKSRAFLSLALQTAREVKNNYPNLLVYAKCVTSHPRSQAFVASFVTTLFQLSVYAQASFVGLKGEANPRESLVYSVTALSKQQPKQLYVPAEHLDIIRDIQERIKQGVECLPYNATPSKEEPSKLTLSVLPGRQYAELVVENVGANFRSELRRQTMHVRQNGVITACLLLPTNAPLDAGIDNCLTDEGYFFCGIKPTIDGSWQVAYTNLLSQAFDFDKLQLFTDDSKRLCDYVKKQYEQTLSI